MADTSFKALGEKSTEFEGFDTFPVSDSLATVTMESDEVTALCPVTEQPDWYRVKFVYAPNRKGLESKTFKLYVQSFRQNGMMCEKLADKMLQDLVAALNPVWGMVVLEQKPRGGVKIVAEARYGKSDSPLIRRPR